MLINNDNLSRGKTENMVNMREMSFDNSPCVINIKKIFIFNYIRVATLVNYIYVIKRVKIL